VTQPLILILYYSRGGRTAALARQAARGVESSGGVARLRTVPPVAPTTTTATPPVPEDGAPYVEIADLIAEALTNRTDETALNRVREKVRELTRRFPLPS